MLFGARYQCETCYMRYIDLLLVTWMLFSFRGMLSQLCRQASTPKRRTLKPQKIVSPPGRFLAGPASSGETIAAIFHLSDCAALVMEDWSPDVPAYALAWTGGTTRNHKALWQEFLAHEALTDQTLQEQFLLLHKIGPPPAYLRTLLGTCVDNLLALWENFVNYQHEKPGRANAPCN